MNKKNMYRSKKSLEDRATERWNDDHESMLKEKAFQKRKGKKVVYIAIAAAVMFVLFMLYGVYVLVWPKSASTTSTSTAPAVVPANNNKFLDDPVFALPSYVYRNR